jgi:translation elongation factor EF-Tu-like GTPase
MEEERPMSRLTVQRTFQLSSRPWLLVTGVLDGGPLNVGDHVVVQAGDRPSAQTVIRSIEIHSAPGTTTIAVDLALGELIRPGTVVVRPE